MLVLVVLLAIGLILLIRFRATPRSGASPTTSAVAVSTTSRPLSPIDLTELYDQDPSFDAPGCWQAVPRGLQTMANIPFRIGGLIELWGEGPAQIGRIYRQMVENNAVTGKFEALYVLHGSSFTTAEGTPIAGVVFRYADGSAATNFIRYGMDSRDWWEPQAEHNPVPTNSASRVVWRGDHPSLPDWARGLRLFGTSILNPKPDAEVKGVDLVSTKSRVTWVVLAMTTGPAGALRVDPRLEQDDIPPEAILMKVTAVDADSGQPIPRMRFRVSLVSGRRLKPYGVFSADEQGHAEIELPPERIKLLSIESFDTNYTFELISWNVAKGEAIPTNYVMKVSKEPR
jgi:hypothetical protein